MGSCCEGRVRDLVRSFGIAWLKRVGESTVDELGLDKDSSSTGVDIYIEKGGMTYESLRSLKDSA